MQHVGVAECGVIGVPDAGRGQIVMAIVVLRAGREPGDAAVKAGMIGGDAQGVFHTDALAGQVRQALQNVVDVLKAGDARPEHVVRMNWYVTDRREYVAAYPEIGKAFRELIGCYNAVMSAVEVSTLVEDRAKVEIEVTAVVPE